MSSETAHNFEVFGEYVLLKQLAAGGMAEVFLARPVNLDANGRVVVIKRILRQVANDPLFIKMFRSEIRVTLGFNHSHTIQVHDFGEIDGQPYIAMEYIEGKSLRQIADRFLHQKELIPVPSLLGLLAQAASGLHYAHDFSNPVTGEAVNAVHRDISPQNLIVSYDGNLKVIDFGIAKAKNEIVEKTRAGQIKGKCAYLSPEQLEEADLDGRSDIFSLGIVAWEMLTAHRLFHKNGDTEMAIMQRIQNCEQFVVPPSRLNPDLPPEVDRVIMRALEKDRSQRYESAAAFQVALRKVLQQHYPNHTYADTAQLMKVLFEQDIVEERAQLRELNDMAQTSLTLQHNSETRVVNSGTDSGIMGGLFKAFGSPKKEMPSAVEQKVANIEAVLKQRATSRHFAIGAFWVLSLIGIKIDERYSLLDRYFLPAPAEADVAPASHRVNEYRAHLREKYGVRRAQMIIDAENSGKPTSDFAEVAAETTAPVAPTPAIVMAPPVREVSAKAEVVAELAEEAKVASEPVSIPVKEAKISNPTPSVPAAVEPVTPTQVVRSAPKVPVVIVKESAKITAKAVSAAARPNAPVAVRSRVPVKEGFRAPAKAASPARGVPAYRKTTAVKLKTVRR